MKVQKETKKAAAAGLVLLVIAVCMILIGLHTGSFRLSPLTVGKENARIGKRISGYTLQNSARHA